MDDSVRDARLGRPCGPLLVNYAMRGKNCAQAHRQRANRLWRLRDARAIAGSSCANEQSHSPPRRPCARKGLRSAPVARRLDMWPAIPNLSLRPLCVEALERWPSGRNSLCGPRIWRCAACLAHSGGQECDGRQGSRVAASERGESVRLRRDGSWRQAQGSRRSEVAASRVVRRRICSPAGFRFETHLRSSAPVAKAVGAVPFTGRVAWSGPVPKLWWRSGALGFETRCRPHYQERQLSASTLALSRGQGSPVYRSFRSDGLSGTQLRDRWLGRSPRRMRPATL